MQTKDILLSLRNKNGLSQEELAEKLFVTRQAVSRWENGDTIPNTEALKLLSKLYDVSINTLLGSPCKLICQCCGMPLKDEDISKEADGIFNEGYCRWCYADGDFTLDFWKQYGGGCKAEFETFKSQLIDEINIILRAEGLPVVENLNVLSGSFINLSYPLSNGTFVQLLDDNATYLGSQLESNRNDGRCFGIAANTQFILLCSYAENGEDPQLLVYKKRECR